MRPASHPSQGANAPLGSTEYGQLRDAQGPGLGLPRYPAMAWDAESEGSEVMEVDSVPASARRDDDTSSFVGAKASRGSPRNPLPDETVRMVRRFQSEEPRYPHMPTLESIALSSSPSLPELHHLPPEQVSSVERRLAMASHNF